MDHVLTKRQAIRAVQNIANAAIEQRERWAKGWDKGKYRDDDTVRIIPCRVAAHIDSADAFAISKEYADAR